MMRVLITRTKEENEQLRIKFKKLNLDLVELNLIKYNRREFDFQKIRKYEYLVISSKYTARILLEKARDFILKDRVKFFVIGNSSAEILSESGYLVEKIFFNAQELFCYVHKILDSKYVLYLSGNYFTLKPNKNIEHMVLYDVEYTNTISSYLLKHITKKEIDFVLLFSENSAKTFISLSSKYYVEEFFQNSVFLVISNRILSYVKNYFPNVIVVNPKDLTSFFEQNG